eukprot:SAG11_NODE_465_length_9217_cov_93.852161_11_plen_215_part_00
MSRSPSPRRMVTTAVWAGEEVDVSGRNPLTSSGLYYACRVTNYGTIEEGGCHGVFLTYTTSADGTLGMKDWAILNPDKDIRETVADNWKGFKNYQQAVDYSNEPQQIVPKKMKDDFELIVNQLLGVLFIALCLIAVKLYSKYRGCDKLDNWTDLVRMGFNTDLICNACFKIQNFCMDAQWHHYLALATGLATFFGMLFKVIVRNGVKACGRCFC